MSAVGFKLSARDGLRAKVLELEARLGAGSLTRGEYESIQYLLKDYLVELKNLEIELMGIPW